MLLLLEPHNSTCPPRGGTMILVKSMKTSINDQTRQRGHTIPSLYCVCVCLLGVRVCCPVPVSPRFQTHVQLFVVFASRRFGPSTRCSPSARCGASTLWSVTPSRTCRTSSRPWPSCSASWVLRCAPSSSTTKWTLASPSWW